MSDGCLSPHRITHIEIIRDKGIENKLSLFEFFYFFTEIFMRFLCLWRNIFHSNFFGYAEPFITLFLEEFLNNYFHDIFFE
jgi:hypothetical protein